MISPVSEKIPVGLIGFGAFGRLAASLIMPWCDVVAHDPAIAAGQEGGVPGVRLTDLAEAASRPVVVLAVPVQALEPVAWAIAPHLWPGALVLDVGSVKVLPAEIMQRILPPHVSIIATHPLFGPQSAARGHAGLKIALCPVRGPHAPLAAFLRCRLRLTVIRTTPEAHDREMAVTQGLTHWLARGLAGFATSPRRMTTASFDLLCTAMAMVRDDAPEVFAAIECANPYSAEMRRACLAALARLDGELEAGIVRRENVPA